jgi:hypothetical protein
VPNDTIGGVIDALRELFEPFEVAGEKVRIGDELIAWRRERYSEWSKVGLRGDTRVTSLGADAAFVGNGDRISLAGYRYQIRRAP